MSAGSVAPVLRNQRHFDERIDLAGAFRWTAQFNTYAHTDRHFGGFKAILDEEEPDYRR